MLAYVSLVDFRNPCDQTTNMKRCLPTVIGGVRLCMQNDRACNHRNREYPGWHGSAVSLCEEGILPIRDRERRQ